MCIKILVYQYKLLILINPQFINAIITIIIDG